MASQWWQFPGPHRAIDEVANALIRGCHVVIGSSQDECIGFYDALEESLSDQHCIRLEQPNSKPTEIVSSVLGWTSYSFSSALQRARGEIILCDSPDVVHWGGWHKFLIELDQYSRSMDELTRLRICLFCPSSEILSSLEQLTTIKISRPFGYISNFDMAAYVSSLNSDKPTVKGDCRIAAIANLALWDVTVADRLSRLRPLSVTAVLKTLKEIGIDRGWHPDIPESEFRRLGIQLEFGGKCQLHSSWLALTTRLSELEIRIWKGQIGVLFPVLEERRKELAHRCLASLSFPLSFRFGDKEELIESLDDLDIGQVYAICKDDKSVSQSDREAVRRCRHMRNAIAHRQLLTDDQILF